MSTRGHFSCVRAFTLVEVMVALALLTMVLGVLFMGTHTVLSSWEQIEVHADDFQHLAVLDRTLDTILTNVVSFRWPEDVEKPTQNVYLQFEGLPESLILTYLHPVNRLEDGGLRQCAFVLENGDFVIYYCDRPPFPEELDDERLRRTVLSRHVSELSFLYGDYDEGGSLVFVDDWEERDYLPFAILVQIVWEDGSAENWLRRTAGSGYYENLGKRDTTLSRQVLGNIR